MMMMNSSDSSTSTTDQRRQIVDHETKAHVELISDGQVKTVSRFHLEDPESAQARSKMTLLDSNPSEEELAWYEEGELFLPYNWMYPEIDAGGVVKEFDHQALKANNVDNPVALGNFLMRPSSLREAAAGTQTNNPWMLPFSNRGAEGSQTIFHQNQPDEFMMYNFKTTPCKRKTAHDNLSCTFIHQGDRAARRDPIKYGYLGELCQEYHETAQCRFGEHCKKSHGTFELWLHPTRYRTRMCDRGRVCWRPYCFLAHKLDKKRPEVYSDVPLYDENKLGFAVLGGATMFGGIVPTFSMQPSHASGSVKPESLGGKRKKMSESETPDQVAVLDATMDYSKIL